MLLLLLLILSSLFGIYFGPIEHLRILTSGIHASCLNLAPISIYREEYQALICGSKTLSHSIGFQASGLNHLFFIYGFQIHLVNLVSKKLLSSKVSQNFSNLFLSFFVLCLTAFHPSSLRSAVSLFLRELSNQKKFFWSPLQIAILSGFFCIGLAPQLSQSYSLLIGWLAAICFCFMNKYSHKCKLLIVPIFIYPVLSGMTLAHPLLAISFSFLYRPILFILLPLTYLAFLIPALSGSLDQFWRLSLSFSDFISKRLTPFHLEFSLTLFEIWIYLLVLMTVFLFLENRKLREV